MIQFLDASVDTIIAVLLLAGTFIALIACCCLGLDYMIDDETWSAITGENQWAVDYAQIDYKANKIIREYLDRAQKMDSGGEESD